MKDTPDMAQANETEDIQILKPTWATIQQAVTAASAAAASEQGAWVKYQAAQAALNASELAKEVTRLRDEWNKAYKYRAGRDTHRDEVLKLALGIPDTEEVTQPE